jgi:hypothetical protein
MSYDKPSVVLAELWERKSQHGNTYFSGFMGNVSVALLYDGEREHPTRPGEVVKVWRLVAQERDRPQRTAAKPAPPEPRSAAPQEPTGETSPPREVAAARPPPARRFRREGKAARQERVSAEIARGYGLESDPDDPIPF